MALATPWKDCRHSTCRHLLHPLLAHEETSTLICALFWLCRIRKELVYWTGLSLPKYSEPPGALNRHSPKLVWDALWVSAFSTQDGKWGAKPFSRGFSNLTSWLAPYPAGLSPWLRSGGRDADEEQAGNFSPASRCSSFLPPASLLPRKGTYLPPVGWEVVVIPYPAWFPPQLCALF